MRYVVLAYNDEKDGESFPGHLAHDEAFRASGHQLASAALQPVRTATTLRIRKGRLITTDGPFAETRERLGGFFLIEAKDLDEALRFASRLPLLPRGSVEVRPVQEPPA